MALKVRKLETFTLKKRRLWMRWEWWTMTHTGVLKYLRSCHMEEGFDFCYPERIRKPLTILWDVEAFSKEAVDLSIFEVVQSSLASSREALSAACGVGYLAAQTTKPKGHLRHACFLLIQLPNGSAVFWSGFLQTACLPLLHAFVPCLTLLGNLLTTPISTVAVFLDVSQGRGGFISWGEN